MSHTSAVLTQGESESDLNIAIEATLKTSYPHTLQLKFVKEDLLHYQITKPQYIIRVHYNIVERNITLLKSLK